MTYDRERHRRRSIRLPGYDDASAGAYLVTPCVQDRACLLGEVVEDEVVPTNPRTGTDAFVVMPDLVHAIVVLGTDPSIDADSAAGGSVGGEGRHGGLPLPTGGAVSERGKTTRSSAPGAGVDGVGADLRVCPPSLPLAMR